MENSGLNNSLTTPHFASDACENRRKYRGGKALNSYFKSERRSIQYVELQK